MKTVKREEGGREEKTKKRGKEGKDKREEGK